jgi:ribosomal protein L7Ae-like RNA K-turn-binding protein/predicted RNA-binding protein YlxR (DUF448 family)
MTQATAKSDGRKAPRKGSSPRARARAAAESPRHARTCIGCGKAAALGQVRRAVARLMGEPTTDPLVRIAIGPNGLVAVDAGQHADSTHGADRGAGRGAYVHASAACVRAAAQRGLARAAKAEPRLDGEIVTAASLATAIREAYGRRARGLLGAAKRSRSLEVGADAVTIAGRSGEAALIVVAADAAQAASLTEVRRAVSEGRAVVWESKASLGEVVRGHATESGVGVVAVTDTRIAGALQETLAIIASLASPSSSGGSGRDSGRSGPSQDGPEEPADESPSGGVGSDSRANGLPTEPVALVEARLVGRDPDRDSVSRNRAAGSASREPVDASIVPGGAATLRGFDDPGNARRTSRVVEWSA